MSRTFFRFMLTVCTATLLFGLVGCESESQGENVVADEKLFDEDELYAVSTADQNIVYEDAQDIMLEDGEVYSVTEAGAYCVTGNQSGQISIDVQDEIVFLILDDATLHSYNGPAIDVVSAAKLVITVPEGTESTVSDTAYYDGFSGRKACIYSDCDLTINGGGSLQVNGYCKDAIHTKDTLKVLDLSLTVEAKNDGIRGNDGVILENAVTDVQCERDGIYTKREDKENLGLVVIRGGSIQIIAGEYGMRVAENAYIEDCAAEISGVAKDILCEGETYIQEGCLQ